MWFKNLLMYQLTQEIELANLEDALESKIFHPCTYQELSSYGFTAPFGKNEYLPLAHISQYFYLIATKK